MIKRSQPSGLRFGLPDEREERLMRPIPRMLLTDTATVTGARGGAYGDQPAAPIAELTHVYVEEERSATVTGNNVQGEYRATLVYDARHSHPKAVVFQPGQAITCHGREYRVERVAEYCTGERLHHVEVELIG